MRITDLPALGGGTLVEQIAEEARTRIDQRLWRPGTRLPSIRELAQARGVSRFTVVEAYDRLVAQGLIEARRGSGFFVALPPSGPQRMTAAPAAARDVDVVWLLRSMFNPGSASHAPGHAPGLGYLPPEWYDGELVARAVRAVGRQSGAALLGAGSAEGYPPLREQLAQVLAQREVAAAPEQIVLTSGATQAIDLVAREVLQPGDTVLVEDPAWFLMFGSFAREGMRVVGVPRLADGPDTAALARIAAEVKPKLFVVNSVCHNPTSSMLSLACAHEVLKLAEAHDFVIVEDDVYADFAPPEARAVRLASLDRFARVIYCGGFSKTLAPNLRVGYLAASPQRCTRLVEHKLLSTLTTPELNERVVCKVIADGRYARHVERLRTRLDLQREKAARAIERAGFRLDGVPRCGLFLWAELGGDSVRVAAAAQSTGIVTAPGSLFSPSQRPSRRMRFNIATSVQPEVLRFLAQAAAEAG